MNEWATSADKWEIESARAKARGDDAAARHANHRAFRCELRSRGMTEMAVEGLVTTIEQRELDSGASAPRIIGILGRDAIELCGDVLAEPVGSPEP